MTAEPHGKSFQAASSVSDSGTGRQVKALAGVCYSTTTTFFASSSGMVRPRAFIMLVLTMI